MSGGFFRGTSADQDTRFSNKQAKLLKSQKFAPELENLVDMTKVKMDVMRPWIAKHVTELIGFEDEVLINFIYSLLEGTAVNGKQVQISLTGFMERNTGKFMKELWALLLSAQQNVSGVPQQFLDAKEEETKKKKAETDRIANEIQKKKEKEKLESQQEKKMDGNDSMSRDKNAELELNVKHDVRGPAMQPTDEKEQYKRNARRGNRGSHSPNSAYRFPSPRPKHSITPSRSSNSASRSDKRRRSSSTSGASPSRSQSIPSEKRHFGKEQSVTPRQRPTVRRSPSPWRRSLHSKQRSTSRSRHRSPSPARRRVRSPWRHRSRSPVRRRSRSPVRRRSRSLVHRRSRCLVRHRSRSPVRHRSRSPVRSRSRTPIRRSPVRYRSRTPIRHRSPSPVQGSSPAFMRGRSPSFVNHRSPSPVHSSSPSPMHHQSASPVQRGSPSLHRQPSPGRRWYRRSPSTPRKRSVSPGRIRPSAHGQKRSNPEETGSPLRIHHSSLSPARRGSVKIARSPMQSPGERARRHENYSPARRASNGRPELLAENRKGIRSVEGKPVVSLRSPQRDMLNQDDLCGKEQDLSSSLQKSPSVSRAFRNRSYSDEQRSEATGLSVKGRDSYDDDGARAKDKKKSWADDSKGGHQFPQQEAPPKSSRESEQNDRNGSLDSPCEETHEHRFKVKGKRKHRKSVRQEVESDNYSSYDSYEERKEAKRRRKEEKKLKKEERRRRREERRRRRDERRFTEKLKLKSGSDSSSSELGQDHSEDDSVRRRGSRVSNAQETESEQKKLEIELREKALESLRAKKGFGN